MKEYKELFRLLNISVYILIIAFYSISNANKIGYDNGYKKGHKDGIIFALDTLDKVLSQKIKEEEITCNVSFK